jgi:hypothetical protein
VSELIKQDQEGAERPWNQHLQVGTERLPKFWVKFGEVVVSRKAGISACDTSVHHTAITPGHGLPSLHQCTTLPSPLNVACLHFVQLWAFDIFMILRIAYNLDRISKRDAAEQRGFPTGNYR